MVCPNCTQDNVTGARFCTKCGTNLEPACPSCGTSNAPGSAFCASCGTEIGSVVASAADLKSHTPTHLANKILSDRAMVGGERRTVTALFADAVGSTAIAEKLDEEEVYAVTQGAVKRMMDAVHRYEGTVTTFRGDGVMALFGAPIAHEDSARRAVSAALEMQRELEEFGREVALDSPQAVYRFRVGLNTGPVIVGNVGDDLVMDYTAVGDTVNLAARMEGLAEPGAVYISENTQKAARDYFELEDVGLLDVKGKAEPVRAYRVTGEKSVRSRFQAAIVRGLTPFVGREKELQTFVDLLEQAKQRHGRVAFLAGDAGMGKSRLITELGMMLGDRARWLRGQCVSYGGSIPYLPVIDFVKNAIGVEESDDDSTIIGKIDDLISPWNESTKRTAPYLKFLLSVDPGDESIVTMDPQIRQAGLFDALRALMTEESRRAPLILFIEDLHWIDEKSEEALRVLIDVAASLPLLIICSFRPGYSQPFGDRSYFSQITLRGLEPGETADIARRLIQSDSLPDDVQQMIVRKAEGNPFFIEEVTKSLVELGVLASSANGHSEGRSLTEVRIPDTITEVILSRIDRLAAEAKRALQLASVIGREFSVRLLNRISQEGHLDDLLGDLKQLELIYEKSYFPELAYMFKHALTHDVAYGTLLLERRKSLHSLVASAIEELYEDRLAEHYETLAHHNYEAQVWDKALKYLNEAGNKATAAFATREALAFYDRALEVAGRIGETAAGSAIEISIARGFINFSLSDLSEGQSDFRRARELAVSLGDRLTEGLAITYEALGAFLDHDIEAAEKLCKEALEIGAEGRDQVRLSALLVLATLLIVVGRRTEATPYRDEAAALVDRVEDHFARATWSIFGQYWPLWAGKFDLALEHLTKWRDAAEKSGQGYMVVAHSWDMGLALSGLGRYEEALERLADAERLSVVIGDSLFRARALNTFGWIYAELQDYERAIEFNRQSIEVGTEIPAPDPEVESNARLNLADNLIALGRYNEAEEHLKWVEKIYRNPTPAERFMLWRYSQHMLHSYGELWLARGDADRALKYADECYEASTGTESAKNVVKALRLKGQALAAMGKLDDAEGALTEAVEIAREVANPPQLWKTLVAMGDLRRGQGREEEAKTTYSEALAEIDRIASTLSDENLRRTFVESEFVAGIREAAH